MVKQSYNRILIVTPRTHPNLRYLASELLSSGFEVSVLVENYSRDFNPLPGLKILPHKSPNSLNSETSEIVIYRHFAGQAVKLAAQLTNPKAIQLSYDQHPIGTDFISKIHAWRFELTRVLLGRPNIRISPTIRTLKVTPSERQHYFKHPGPAILGELDRQKKNGIIE